MVTLREVTCAGRAERLRSGHVAGGPPQSCPAPGFTETGEVDEDERVIRLDLA